MRTQEYKTIFVTVRPGQCSASSSHNKNDGPGQEEEEEEMEILASTAFPAKPGRGSNPTKQMSFKR
jgi:hypothetical protein